jgi:hypothetical protein
MAKSKPKKAAKKKAPKKKAPKKAAKKAAKKAPAPKKATPAKKAPKKAPPKAAKKKAGRGPGRPLFTKESLTNVTYNFRFIGGAGSIQLQGENIDKTLTSAVPFTVGQSAGAKTTFVGGTAPTGPNGRIEVQVTKADGTVLSDFSSNVFTGFFNSNILYSI